jgi:hypothetical protein
VAIDEEKPDFALDIAKDAGRTLQCLPASDAQHCGVSPLELGLFKIVFV